MADTDAESRAFMISLLVELGKIGIITGAALCPLGWAAVIIAGGAIASGVYEYNFGEQQGDLTRGVISSGEFVLSAIPATKAFKGMSVVGKEVALEVAENAVMRANYANAALEGGKAVVAGISEYNTSGNVGTAGFVTASKLVTGAIKLNTKSASAFSAMLAKRGVPVDHSALATSPHSTLILTGIEHSVAVATDTTVGLMSGKDARDAWGSALLKLADTRVGSHLSNKTAHLLPESLRSHLAKVPLVSRSWGIGMALADLDRQAVRGSALQTLEGRADSVFSERLRGVPGFDDAVAFLDVSQQTRRSSNYTQQFVLTRIA